ncbi:hypothetical protein BGZ80_005551 [Entomortierella chlamydospora]|uniref:BHLH domain-containing protein n=1 Tax=Entomortierella chlamydospora TaxID=101097 RepID=A0A9P6SUX7_9FUNG|nr:hypothetical protein BGZ80_005551 [Entomortierella chlamydospora]
MNSSRRGSLADPEYYPPGPTSGVLRRPSVSMDSSNGYSAGGGGGGGENRHYATTPPLPSAPEHHYPPYPHPSTSPMQLRQSEHGLGRRESLPSIHSSAGPIGQLLAQEPQRRHSIANGDQVGPLKRKTSATPLSQVHSSVELEHPSKRRDSIPDAALLHQFANHPHHHHPYHSRSSLSAPSSPPRRGSIAHAHGHGQVPVLNLQPAAEIKSSSSSSMIPSAPPPSQQNGSSAMMEHSSNRPLFPSHQPRRPSLLSDASLSRRSSIADPHHYPAHFQQQQGHPHNGTSSSQDYDHNMNMDMERMHLSGNHGSSETAPQGQAQGGGHLYPGYPSSTYPEGAGAKGDTPYSRSPELRISHKLAERKRRKEMKELFDELRDSLPVDRSLKTSKWEILSKAVDYISNMKATQDEMANEIDMLRQEVARLQKH